jgi:hypothetical protein
MPLILRYFDVALVVLAAPIMLLAGVPAVGYAVGAGTWIALRAVGAGVEHYAAATSDPKRTISVRLAYMLGRLFTLALAIILVRRGDGANAGLTALVVIVFAYTIGLATSFATRPGKGPR